MMRTRPGQTDQVDDGPTRACRLIEMPGGADAPARARAWVLSCLRDEPIGICEDDLALIISELVTNSVVHARVDGSRTLQVVVVSLRDRYRISVLDPGCPEEPRLVLPESRAAGGLGLRVVAALSQSWGTFRGSDETRHVWCELPRRHPSAVQGREPAGSLARAAVSSQNG
jgi:histidine kinase-like protein